MKHRPLALIILDGFGYRETMEANAIASAHAPTWHSLWKNYPHTLLTGSGLSVGLPEGQMGNSEVGHLTMGAGRVIDQDLTRISKSIENGSFNQNTVLQETIQIAKKHSSTLHILGLLSPGGVHSHEDHILAMLKMAENEGIHTILHAFLDGRDTPPRSALSSLQKMDSFCVASRGCRVGSITGRFYAMDRDKRYERTELAYALLVEGETPYHAESAISALELAYARAEGDEFVKPTLIGEDHSIKSGDVVVFMNFRADRARQLSRALVDPDFTGFQRKSWPKLAAFTTLTLYSKELSAKVAFPPESLSNLLGEYLEAHHLKQLRIAETEKYAHITFFFNGGRDEPYPHEERILIPSPKVATYDLHPEMSAREVTDTLVEKILEKRFDVIICNFANADMVGHSGNFEATVLAIEVLDKCLQRIVEALKEVGGETIITADHGNAEYMFDEKSGQPHTAHTISPVPFVFVGRAATIAPVQKPALSDIAPTMVSLLGLPIPKEMTGRSLLKLD